MTDEQLRADLVAVLLAVHRMAARFLKSAYRPIAADFEQLAAACVDVMPFRVLVINKTLEPVVKIDQLVTKLEELAAKFARKKRATRGAN